MSTPLGSPRMKVETERLCLMPLELKVIDRMVSLANNEKVAYMTARMPHPYVRKDARDFIVYANKAMILGEELSLGIHLKDFLPEEQSAEDEEGAEENQEDDAPLSTPEPRPEEEKLIGVCGFMIKEDRPPEIGYWIGEEYWGNGFGTEAAGAIVEYIKTMDQFDRIHARVLPDNQASIRIIEGLGFTYTGEAIENPKNREGTVHMRCYDLELKSS